MFLIVKLLIVNFFAVDLLGMSSLRVNLLVLLDLLEKNVFSILPDDTKYGHEYNS